MLPDFTLNKGANATSIFDRRILRRVSLTEGATGEGDHSIPTSVACVVDVETIGFSLDKDAIIELALRRIHFDTEGVVTDIEPAHVWREDPCRPVPDKTVRHTGATNRHVEGPRIDQDEVLCLMASSDIVIAHFAQFARPFLSKRIPPLAEMLWGCSCHDVDWAHNGFEGRSLGWLCCQTGWFRDGHRALANVDAIITLLRHPQLDGTTFLSELVSNVIQTSTYCLRTSAWKRSHDRG